ncbi:MAG: hypothetical protein AAFV29_18175, partial [Myxococcota bacterium]
MRTLSMLVVPLAVVGCGNSNTVTVDLRGVTANLAALVSLNAEGEPVRLSDTFGLDAGTVTFGAPPQWTLENEESTLVAITIDDAALNALYGEFTPAEGKI